jgi:membrane protease YdiL (CAAX protease family)
MTPRMPASTETYLIGVVGSSVIHLLLLVPLFAIALLTSRRPRWRLPLLLFAAFLTLDVALLSLYALIRFVPAWGGWNWQGKLLEACWPLALVAFAPMFSAGNTGLTFETSPGSWTVMSVLCAIYALLNAPLQLGLGAHLSWHVKPATLLFEATLPGMAEEFVYRGVLLTLLNKMFGRPWRLWGAQFGWGLLIISVLFGLLHGLDIHDFSVQRIYWAPMIFAFIVGLALAWLRERTGSVWPGVVFHNFANVMNFFFA